MDELDELRRFFVLPDFARPPMRLPPMRVRSTITRHIRRWKIIGETSAAGGKEGSARITLIDRGSVLQTKSLSGVKEYRMRMEVNRLADIMRRIPQTILSRDVLEAVKRQR
jgi:hypothetical protein